MTLEDIATSYRAEAVRLQSEIDRARAQYRLTGLYTDKVRLRLLWEIRRDLVLLADYLGGYYGRKFANTKNTAYMFDLFSFEKRNRRSGARNMDGFAASAGDPEETRFGCYGEGTDSDAERGFDYVPLRDEGS